MKIKVNNLKLLKEGGDIPKYQHAFSKLGRKSNKKTFVAPKIPKHNAYEVVTDNNGKVVSERRYYTKYPGVHSFKRSLLEIQDRINSKQQPTVLTPSLTSSSRRRSTVKKPIVTTTQSTTVLPVTTQTSNSPETTTTINAPMYLNLLSDMTMYKNNPNTFVERFGNLNGNYTGFASKTPGLQYATSINDMTDEARNLYLLGLKGLYDMYQKNPTEAINYAKYNFFVPLNNATVGDYALAQLNGTKPQNNTSPAFYDLITNWYANNKPTIDNYFNNNTNYSQDFNLRVLNFLDRYKLYRPKYTFAKNGSKLLRNNSLYK